MTSREKLFSTSTRRAERALVVFGEEVRHARIALAMTQGNVARMVAMSQPQISRVEAGRLITLSLVDASRTAAAVGLDLSVKAYPSSRRPRDAPSLNRLRALLANAQPPLSFRLEVPLPSNGPFPDQRAWDAMIERGGAETAVELEVRLYDFQAQTRRIFLKQRDDPGKGLLVVVANTAANRRVLDEHRDMFGGLQRLRTRDVVAALRAGKHPPSGIVLF